MNKKKKIRSSDVEYASWLLDFGNCTIQAFQIPDSRKYSDITEDIYVKHISINEIYQEELYLPVITLMHRYEITKYYIWSKVKSIPTEA